MSDSAGRVRTRSTLVVREICTGCASVRERKVGRAEYERLRNVAIADRAQHTDCLADPNLRHEWVAVSGRQVTS